MSSFQPMKRTESELHSSVMRGNGPRSIYVQADKYSSVALSAASTEHTTRLTFNAQDARLIAAELIAAANSIQPEPELSDAGPIAEGWQISIADGHSGYGVYAHMTEYADEGAVFLLSVPARAVAEAA
jgi:hypothetical protein